MNNKNHTLISVACLCLLLSACDQGKPQHKAPTDSVAPTLDQSLICETKNWQQVVNCQSGQKVVFLPERWGNQQLPILFAAAHCDMRYSIALTEGGVACIYHPLKTASASN